ncbi:methyltransferase domain-containing protein [Streptomyces sp. NPDC059649]|uniref:methyltransferase domain-containing protein n=1 Tax=Streptomyces sp. NPDC059649 TaxID=3346895 RepID=UPI0036956A27
MNTWINPVHGGEPLADLYARHSGTLRGVLRHHLVDRALSEHLPAEPPQRVLDIGGGTGAQARALAERGHRVTVLDPDEDMLEGAHSTWQPHAKNAAGTVTFLHGLGEHAPQLAGTGWDAVLCHGVLMYLQDPTPLLHSIAHCVRPGGLVSVLAKQDTALAMRPALERNWSGVLEVLRSPVERGRLAVVSRGVSRQEVARLLAERGVRTQRWYGVRCFTDHLGDESPGADFPQVLEAEWAAGRRDPYRLIARHFHLIARA